MHCMKVNSFVGVGAEGWGAVSGGLIYCFMMCFGFFSFFCFFVLLLSSSFDPVRLTGRKNPRTDYIPLSSPLPHPTRLFLSFSFFRGGRKQVFPSEMEFRANQFYPSQGWRCLGWGVDVERRVLVPSLRCKRILLQICGRIVFVCSFGCCLLQHMGFCMFTSWILKTCVDQAERTIVKLFLFQC